MSIETLLQTREKCEKIIDQLIRGNDNSEVKRTNSVSFSFIKEKIGYEAAFNDFKENSVSINLYKDNSEIPLRILNISFDKDSKVNMYNCQYDTLSIFLENEILLSKKH